MTRTARPSPTRLVRIAEAAEYAGVTRATLRRWITDGRLPGKRRGPKLLLVDLDDVDALTSPVNPMNDAIA